MTKIATWNVNSLKVRLDHVLDWLAAEKPDVLALQETKTVDENFPAEQIEAAGYQAAFAGQKTYNGVAILSLAPGEEVVTDLPGLDDPQRRILASTIDGVRVLNVYVPNGKEVGSDKYAYKISATSTSPRRTGTSMIPRSGGARSSAAIPSGPPSARCSTWVSAISSGASSRRSGSSAGGTTGCWAFAAITACAST
jgi:hypothetical protein